MAAGGSGSASQEGDAREAGGAVAAPRLVDEVQARGRRGLGRAVAGAVVDQHHRREVARGEQRRERRGQPGQRVDLVAGRNDEAQSGGRCGCGLRCGRFQGSRRYEGYPRGDGR